MEKKELIKAIEAQGNQASVLMPEVVKAIPELDLSATSLGILQFVTVPGRSTYAKADLPVSFNALFSEVIYQHTTANVYIFGLEVNGVQYKGRYYESLSPGFSYRSVEYDSEGRTAYITPFPSLACNFVNLRDGDSELPPAKAAWLVFYDKTSKLLPYIIIEKNA